MSDHNQTTPWRRYPTQEAYDKAWLEQCLAMEIAARDGIRIPRWLPQFRPVGPDPVGDHYRNLARKEIASHGRSR